MPPTPTTSRPRLPARAGDATPFALVGKRLLSGTNEDLGVVVGIERDPQGRPASLRFVERDGAPPRSVPLRFVRRIDDRAVRLSGPREGYHITRVST